MPCSGHFFLYDTHKEALASIEGVNFTPRERDILSCLISVRGTRKISSLLSISPNTILSHIRNIMLKLACNSREGIIDFLEQSQCVSLVNAHYNHLILHATFEKCLKDRGRNNTKKGKTAKRVLLIFHGGKQEFRNTLRLQLKSHLRQTGLRVDIEPTHATEKINASKTNTYVLLLYLEEKIQETIPQEFHAFDFINLFEHKNYYLFVFAVLKRLLPTIDWTSHSQNLMSRLQRIAVPPSSSPHYPINKTMNKNKVTTRRVQKEIKYIKDKKIYISLVIFCILVGLYACQIFQARQSLKQFKIYLELPIPVHVVLLQRSEEISERQNAEREKHVFAEPHFVITGVSIYLEKAHKDLGEHGGAKTGENLNKTETQKGSKGHASSK